MAEEVSVKMYKADGQLNQLNNNIIFNFILLLLDAFLRYLLASFLLSFSF